MDRLSRPPVILIVDDDPTILAALRLFLQMLAPTHEIISVQDGHSALRYLTNRTIPLLITDYMMPGMDGLQLTAAVKLASPMTHVILATAYGSAALEQRAREQHVDTFLPKTALRNRLAAVVASVLALDGGVAPLNVPARDDQLGQATPYRAHPSVTAEQIAQ